MGWTELRDAMHAAMVSASGLAPVATVNGPTDSVIWKWQDANQPPLPYLAMTVSAATNPGQDGLFTDTDLNRPAGQEVRIQVVGFREIVWGIEIFTDQRTGAGDALDIAETIRVKLRLPSIRDALGAVGVTPFDDAPVRFLPEIVAVGFRGRALLDIRCFAPAAAASEFIGYIASVEGTLTRRGGMQPEEEHEF